MPDAIMDQDITLQAALACEGSKAQRDMFTGRLFLARQELEFEEHRTLAAELFTMKRDEPGRMTPGQWAYLLDIYSDRLGLPKIKPAAAPRSLRTGEVLQAAPRCGWRLTPEKRLRRINRQADDILPREHRQGHVASYIVVMTVVLIEILRHGRCQLFGAQIGAFGGYERTSVRNTIKEAERPSSDASPLIAVERRRTQGRRKNHSNVITLVCPKLLAHLKVRARHMRGLSRRGRAYWGLPLAPTTSNFQESTGIQGERISGTGLSAGSMDGLGAPSAPERLGGGSTARAAPA